MKTKQLLLIILSIFFAAGILSCSTEEPIIYSDPIKLSKRSITFTEDNTDKVTIRTEGKRWWIRDMVINDECYYPGYETTEFENEFITIKVDWLTIDKIDLTTLEISVAKNPYGARRCATITVGVDNYSDCITVVQSGDPNVPVSLLPKTIIATEFSLASIDVAEITNIYKFTYDEQNRINTITHLQTPSSLNLPMWVLSYEYDENMITVTESSSNSSDSDYVNETIVTRYEVIGNKVYINDTDTIDIDNDGRASINEFEYDENNNITAYRDYAYNPHMTVEYDDKNGIFRNVNMPHWYISTQLEVWNAKLYLFNNVVFAWFTENMDEKNAAYYEYKTQYNEYDYPSWIERNEIRILSGAHGKCEIRYTNAN